MAEKRKLETDLRVFSIIAIGRDQVISDLFEKIGDNKMNNSAFIRPRKIISTFLVMYLVCLLKLMLT